MEDALALTGKIKGAARKLVALKHSRKEIADGR